MAAKLSSTIMNHVGLTQQDRFGAALDHDAEEHDQGQSDLVGRGFQAEQRQDPDEGFNQQARQQENPHRAQLQRHLQISIVRVRRKPSDSTPDLADNLVAAIPKPLKTVTEDRRVQCGLPGERPKLSASGE